MSEIALSGNAVRKHSALSNTALWVLCAAWFAVVLVLGTNNFFVAPQGAPPFTLLIGATVPIIAFLLAISLSTSVREFVLTADLKVATAVQAWRLGGYTFLILYAHGLLPGYFAWPAGIGDMFIGVTAPLVLAQMRKPDFVKTRTFVVWNLFGILDLVVAVGMGALGPSLTGSPAGASPTTAMSQMPLVLIPTFFVPIFVVLHLVALLQARRLTRIHRFHRLHKFQDNNQPLSNPARRRPSVI
jgi:hypothetical protein